MNVLIVSPFYEDNPSISRPSFVADVLRKKSVKVTVLTSNFSHPTKVWRDLNNCVQLKTIKYRTNTSITRFLSHFILALKFSFWIIKNRNKFDKIYVTMPFGLTALFVSFFIKEKLIVDIVDFWPGSLPFPKRLTKLLGVFFRFWKWLNTKAVKRADKVISLSSKFLEEAGVSASGIQIYLGAKKAQMEEQVLAKDELRILYVGNVGKLYDFYTLLDAIQSCKFKCSVGIVGIGDELESVVARMEELNIPFKAHGAIYDERIIAEIAANSDIGFNGFVDTTASLSYKSISYMSHSLPIVNSMKGDLWEIVEAERVGFNYFAKESKSLAIQLGRFWELKNIDSDWVELKSNVDRVFEQKFEVNVVSRQILEVFSNEKGI